MDNDLVWLEQAACQDTHLVGSKAANLSLLTANYQIPNGFCLTTVALEKYTLPQTNSLPPAIKAKLLAAYEQLAASCHLENPPVAVRSSAEGEDGEDASFAGQYDTYLNVIGKEHLCDAVFRCWASANNSRVQSYHQAQGKMAVFIQLLVPADMALVSFSANPVTGNTDEIIINSTWGLGESLVGGTVTPDSYTLQKTTLAVLEKSVATKLVMTIRDTQEIHEVPIPRPMQALSSLSDTQIKEVGSLVKKLENHMGWPVDIECAYQENTLYLLQCRPITT